MNASKGTRIRLGPLVVEFPVQNERTGLVLMPAKAPVKRAKRRQHLKGVAVDAYARALALKFPAWSVDSMVQVKLRGDVAPPAFAQGRTLRNGSTTEALRWRSQKVIRENGSVCVRTELSHPGGWIAIHHLKWNRGSSFIECRTEIENRSQAAIELEMISSFSLGGITPFAEDDAPGRLKLHRLRSVWSMEARLETRAVEELQLEPSWSGWGARSERFGALGSLPVSGYFPWVAVEDTVAGVTWAAEVAHAGSWQIEAYRRDDTLCLSGGLADREFGHWTKRIECGETFSSPTARLTCVVGSVDQAAAALLATGETTVREALPVVFNEWATSWGRPTHDAMTRLAARLRDRGIDTLVIDAGWYAPENGDWGRAHGDWTPNRQLYPGGIAATAEVIRREGLRPGLWFEFETCGPESTLWSREDLLLRRDGHIVTVGNRRFLDLRNSETVAYLAARVIGLLREGGFGYLKVDYNENIGLGVDGAESLGEGLRMHLEGVRSFFRRIRQELPDIVIENCSSGGHRLERSMMELCDVGSFSDAHEGLEIPIIAANLHRAMAPAQSLVWVVLRKGESEARTVYSLAAGFLGRICLSGDALAWSSGQWQWLDAALKLHADCSTLLRSGTTYRQGPPVLSYRHPEGWQAVLRVAEHGRAALVVGHSFGGKTDAVVILPEGKWTIRTALHREGQGPVLRRNRLRWRTTQEAEAFVIHLIRTDAPITP